MRRHSLWGGDAAHMSSAQFHKSVIAIRTGGCLSEAEQHSIFPFFNPFFFVLCSAYNGTVVPAWVLYAWYQAFNCPNVELFLLAHTNISECTIASLCFNGRSITEVLVEVCDVGISPCLPLCLGWRVGKWSHSTAHVSDTPGYCLLHQRLSFLLYQNTRAMLPALRSHVAGKNARACGKCCSTQRCCHFLNKCIQLEAAKCQECMRTKWLP